ncbi:endonuclease/exonuclease/phosphatase family protein [Mycobacterium sp. smrl_JER01]|uniref:endonuclease/exonuclease/phosphatase family protein n=1 Tax=Mycobacterium sp. smrl_JER01 TaxID=3402633 RepID=UPI003AC76117
MTGAPIPVLRRFIALAAIGSALCAAAGVTAHFLGPVSTTVTLFASFTPLFVLLAAVSAIVLVAVRFRLAAAVALLIVAVGAAAQMPIFVGAPTAASAGALTIRLLQANIRLGQADPQSLVDTVRADKVDLLTVAELTPDAVDRLAAAGMTQSLPFAYLRPREGGGGEGIYSRYPLGDTAELPGLRHANLRAVVAVPGAGPIAVYALHPLPPYPEPAWRWALELDRIGAYLAAEQRPLLVGADFNSTYDHERYRNLLREGGRDGAALIDAAVQLGKGIVATYPADRWFPAVLAIDKILSRGPVPLSLSRVDLPGSDHYGVLAELELSSAGRR